VNKEEYKVGQILYLIQSNKFSIAPVQVVEHITKTTLRGVETVYNVAVPGGEETIELSEFNGSVFKTITEVRSHMLENAHRSIDDLINKCVVKSEEYFSTPETELYVPSAEEETLQVDLGNGQVGRINISQDSLSAEESEEPTPAPRRRGRPPKKVGKK